MGYSKLYFFSGTSCSTPLAATMLVIYDAYRMSKGLKKLTRQEAYDFMLKNVDDKETPGRDDKSGHGLFRLPNYIPILVKPVSPKPISPKPEIPKPVPPKPILQLSLVGYLAKGHKGEDVKNLQTALIHLGFLNDRADGIFGVNTLRAVQHFQIANKLVVDGIAGRLTKERINESLRNQTSIITPPTSFTQLTFNGFLTMGNRGEDVKELQAVLVKLGFLNDVIDGIFGNNTRNAVRSFQKSNGLIGDGVAGLRTKNKLNDILKVRKIII